MGATGAFAAGGDPPRRVVSTNLCTDQMAMLLAAPGQLVSVGYLARDRVSSALSHEAAAYPVNHGQAEEIAFLRPDLVLAGAHGNPATIAMLERLGIPVARFAPEASLADIRANLRAMGAVMGRAARAEELIALMDARLDALAARLPADRPLGAVYYSGGYTAGSESLAGDMLRAAGIDNLAERLGMTWGGTLSLEQLVLSRPDTIVRGQRYGGHSRGEEMLTHPVLARYMAARAEGHEDAPPADATSYDRVLSHAGHSDADPSNPELSDAEPSKVGPSQVEPSAPSPSDTPSVAMTPALSPAGRATYSPADPIGPETTPAWVCGTPLVAAAIADLARVVHGLPPTGGETP